MGLIDLDVEVGMDIDESPLVHLNQEVDEILELLGELGNTNIDSMGLDAIVADFGEWENTINDVDASLNTIDDSTINDVSNSAGIASKAMDLLKVGVLAVGTALGGLAMSAGAFYMEADAAFGRLEAQTGATNEEMQLFESTAKEVFTRGYGGDINEVTESLARVEQNMHAVNETELGDVTANAMLLADILDSDVNEVTRGAQNLMDAFGISSEKAFDLFTKGGQSGLNLSNDMFDQMAEFSAVAIQSGYSVEEFFGVMQRGAQNGVYNLDRVNNSILEFELLTTDGNKATGEAFKQLSKSTQSLWDDMQNGEATAKDLSTTVINELKAMDDQNLANQIGIALWGTVWEDNTKDVMYAMFETTEAMQGFEGATDAAADAVENTLSNRMTRVWRKLQDGIAGVVENTNAQEFLNTIVTEVEELIPLVISSTEAVFGFGLEVVSTFEGAGTAVTGFIDQYDWLILGIASSVATYYVIAGAIGVYNAALLFAAGTGPIYTAVTAGMTMATTAFGTAVSFVLSPIGAIVIGIGAAVAVGVLLYKNWDTVKERANELWQKLNDNPFTSFLLQINPVVAVARTLYNNFDDIKASFDRFKNAISNFQLPGWVTSIGGAIGSATSKLASYVPGFDTGIGRVPHDMIAEIHKDEAIIPAADAQILRDIGVINSDGRYPDISLDNLRGDGGSSGNSTYNTRHASSSSTVVQAPVTLIVQGGNTNEETDQSMIDALEEFFADLGMVMPQVREV